jgi:ABC-2 type transport system ATP-binding protein
VVGDRAEQERMPTVTVSSVHKRFGAIRAVQDVSFEVFPGEIFGLLGPNGAGKTTTIRMMLDIFQPDGGQISVFGGPLDQAKKQRIGYLPEERGLYKDQTLEHVLIYLGTLKGLDEGPVRNRLYDWLKRLDLYEHRQKQVQALSRGMQQKAQLIATLLHEPDLIVVDEPFSGLDPVNTRLVKEIIEEQCHAGKTIIMSTHQMYQVEAMCTRIVLINRGRSILYGQVDQIKRRFAGNAVNVAGRGDLSNLRGVLETRAIDGLWRLTLERDVRPQDIFCQLAERDVQVERFEVAEPSLEDIFVSVVQGNWEPEGVNGA